MTGPEFGAISTQIQQGWASFPIAAAGFDGYAEYLADLDYGDVSAAIAALQFDASDRTPTPGQIRRKIVELELDAPQWDRARSLLMVWRRGSVDRQTRAGSWTCPHAACDGNGLVHDEDTNTATDCRCRPQYLAALRGTDQLPALLRQFVEERAVNGGELDILFDGFDTTLEAQVRQRWQQFIGRAIDSRLLATVDGATLPRIAAARAEEHEHPERVERGNRVEIPARGFDVLSALPSGLEVVAR